MELKLLLLVLIHFLLQGCKNKSASKENFDSYNTFLIQEANKKQCTLIGGRFNYFKDSLENVTYFLKPYGIDYDSINKLNLYFHSWPTAYSCTKNQFVVIEKENKSRFLISFCDENFKGLFKVSRTKEPLILKSPQVESDINELLKSAKLKNSKYFVAKLFKSQKWEPLDYNSVNKHFHGRDSAIVTNRVIEMMSQKEYQYFKTRNPNGVYEVKILNNGLVDINIINYRNMKCFEI